MRERRRGLAADTVFFDLVLQRAKTDAKKFRRFFAMIRDFSQGSLNDIPFDLLQ